MTPTAKSLRLLRQFGYVCQVVESWVPHTQIRRDFLGAIDIIGVKAGESPLGVQATTSSHHAHRLAKARALPGLRAWLAAGCRFEVWSWDSRGVRREALAGEDLAVEVVSRPPRRRRSRKGEPQGLLFD
jgi:hypothetical protein